MSEPLTALSVIRLLAEPNRLRALSAVALGATRVTAVADAAGLTAKEASRAVGALVAGGLLSTVDGELAVAAGALRQLAQDATEVSEADDFGATDPAVVSALRTFIVNGRLVSMPAARAKRLAVLEHIALAFEPGVRYPEREVDAILRAWHDDHAALRRYLVDESLLAREAGVYWRIGGHHPV
ncbi:DUF2087 domain-containing protein [Fodinicola acaciae]|uniref:DUF2087 domain-containing protein n=1 Tax=Fodinicola acaciae TaxID=2681555 RepID=UPI0013D05DFA|nr:DUF2087 domain-containing protein [Fodinicola acaciae]